MDTFQSTIKKLCTNSIKIRDHISSVLRKPCFSEVSAIQMIGKGYVKVSKEYLAESVVTLTTLGEILDCIETSNPAVSSRIQDSLQPGDNAAAIKGARWGLIDGFTRSKNIIPIRSYRILKS